MQNCCFFEKFSSPFDIPWSVELFLHCNTPGDANSWLNKEIPAILMRISDPLF